MHFRTLLIEPPGIDSQLIRVMLAPEKFQVEAAECGPDAWNLIQRTEAPDLVVIDTDLPLSGDLHIGASQILELMSSRPEWRQTPKLILVTEQKPGMLQMARNAGSSVIILKPYDPRRFMQEIFNSLTQILEHHIETVNHQHVQLAARLQRAAQDERNDCNPGQAHKTTLAGILDAIEEHFAFEERFMSRHNYPGFIEHHSNHQQRLERARVLTQTPVDNSADQVANSAERLRNELFDDIEDDRKYIDFLHGLRRSLGVGEKPVPGADNSG